MRRNLGTCLTLIILGIPIASSIGQAPQVRRPQPGGGAAAAGPEQAPMNARVPANDPKTEQLLRDWEKKSTQLTTLDVGFERVDKSPAWPDSQYYSGRAFLQSPNLACLHFEKLPKAPKDMKTKEDHERIVVTGKEVRQYDYMTQQIFVFPLAKNERNRAIQEGPLPFLFNMKADEAKQRYVMTIKNENATAYLLEVIPRLEADRDVFSRAYLQLSKATFLPDRLLLVMPNQKDTQDYKFNGVKSNQQINPQFFQPLKINGWVERVNPAPDAPVPQQGRPAAGRPPIGGRAVAPPR